MGPPPFGDGNVGGSLIFPLGSLASMGPPPFGDGNTEKAGATLATKQKLQWGHHLSAMETGRPVMDLTDVLAASMGPPPFGDGNPARPTHSPSRTPLLQWGHHLSAMETGQQHRVILRLRPLQWGHHLSAMETDERNDTDHDGIRKLQWGHHLSAMETVSPASVAVGMIPRFNGATTFRRWKQDTR